MAMMSEFDTVPDKEAVARRLKPDKPFCNNDYTRNLGIP
jgi:hypothetical protein